MEMTGKTGGRCEGVYDRPQENDLGDAEQLEHDMIEGTMYRAAKFPGKRLADGR